jgi:hypothetical protein
MSIAGFVVSACFVVGGPLCIADLMLCSVRFDHMLRDTLQGGSIDFRSSIIHRWLLGNIERQHVHSYAWVCIDCVNIWEGESPWVLILCNWRERPRDHTLRWETDINLLFVKQGQTRYGMGWR